MSKLLLPRFWPNFNGSVPETIFNRFQLSRLHFFISAISQLLQYRFWSEFVTQFFGGLIFVHHIFFNKLLLVQIFSDPIFFQLKNFPTQIFSNPKYFPTQNIFWPNIFPTQHFFRPKICLRSKAFQAENFRLKSCCQAQTKLEFQLASVEPNPQHFSPTYPPPDRKSLEQTSRLL